MGFDGGKIGRIEFKLNLELSRLSFGLPSPLIAVTLTHHAY